MSLGEKGCWSGLLSQETALTKLHTKTRKQAANQAKICFKYFSVISSLVFTANLTWRSTASLQLAFLSNSSTFLPSENINSETETDQNREEKIKRRRLARRRKRDKKFHKIFINYCWRRGGNKKRAETKRLEQERNICSVRSRCTSKGSDEFATAIAN